jgi:NitT/TauT family transport system permease protein
MRHGPRRAAAPGLCCFRYWTSSNRSRSWVFSLLPVFPYYVTGAITASGGSWNASIVAEAVSWGDEHLWAYGIGAYIAEATEAGNYPEILLGIAVMSAYVVALNRIFWRPLYRYAERKFRLG